MEEADRQMGVNGWKKRVEVWVKKKKKTGRMDERTGPNASLVLHVNIQMFTKTLKKIVQKMMKLND